MQNTYLCHVVFIKRNITPKKQTIMKKIILAAFAVVAMLSVASCGNKNNATTTENDSTATEITATEGVDEAIATLDEKLNAGDAQAFQTAAAEVQKHYAQLISEGKLEEAKAYAEKMKKYFEEHSDAIKTIASGNTTINDVVNYVTNLPSDAATTAEEAAAYLKNVPTSVANAAVSDVKNAAADAEKAVTETATEAVNNAKNKANDAANAAVEGTKNAVNEKVDAAAKKGTDALNNAANKLHLK